MVDKYVICGLSGYIRKCFVVSKKLALITMSENYACASKGR